MSDKFFGEAMYERGYTALVSVIPPGAQLTPSSTINQSQTGKVPGRRLANGLWAGYDWRKHEPSVDDVRQWSIDGANIGLRADTFPSVDIDCTDPVLSSFIEEVAREHLGPAPKRVGRAPKALLMYRCDHPFTRMRLFIKSADGAQHLVEILATGQQFLVHGTHPSTLRPYEWDIAISERAASLLYTITREKAAAFLDTLEQALSDQGYTVQREGDGAQRVTSAGDQNELLAPSIAVLRETVMMIPNTDAVAPGRDDYIRMGAAIRAASGEESDHGYQIFAQWAGSRIPDERVAGNYETWRSDWRRFKPPFKVGWSWIADKARAFGYKDAASDFDAIEETPSEPLTSAPAHSEQWLAERVVERRRDVLRFVPQEGKYLCWDQTRWRRDAELLAEDIIKRELKHLANVALRSGVTPKELRASELLAIQFCSAGKSSAVAQFLRSDRNIAVSMAALDHDPWLLNTPSGIVDLKSGELRASDPDALCTKSTSVPPDFTGSCPNWRRFLAEVTEGNRALEAYLQRLCGYCLTGITREQHLSFITGPGGNGKGVFLNVLSGILGDYAKQADMSTFTASAHERHSTDVAMLVGARLVTASETEAGKRWDDARIRGMTGGDPVTARFMRQDNFTYTPQFKLVFIGNHRPEVREVDDAMRRRIQMVPFLVKPAVVDMDLGEKLREEWPAILAWMVQGCLAWQEIGLAPPPVVRDATDEYFREEDAIGRWMGDRTIPNPDGEVLTEDLFRSWREWTNEHGEYTGSLKRFAAALVQRRVERWQHPDSRRRGFRGFTLDKRMDIEVMT